MDNFFKKNIKNKMNRIFEIASDQDATLKKVLERLDKQEAQQSNLFDRLEKQEYAMKNYLTIKTDITSLHTDLIEKQEGILNGYKEANRKLIEKVIFNNIIIDQR